MIEQNQEEFLNADDSHLTGLEKVRKLNETYKLVRIKYLEIC